jgi:hypothetical protein
LKFITATDRYIFRLVMLPLLGTLAIAASLLLLEKMLSLFDFVAAEGRSACCSAYCWRSGVLQPLQNSTFSVLWG